MFLLYPVALGILIAVLTRGRLSALGDLPLRYGYLIALGFVIQVVIFLGPVSERVGELGPPLYIGSTVLVLGAIAANWRIRGIPVVVAGSASNLAAIGANGGYMPADPGALAALGHGVNPGYSNSAVIAEPAVRFLTDIFAMPRWMPFANVFSVGDVLIGLGVIVVLYFGTRRRIVTPGMSNDELLEALRPTGLKPAPLRSPRTRS
jgi:hypothetical protein